MQAGTALGTGGTASAVPFRVTEVGVDWLTITTKGPAREPVLRALMDDLGRQLEAAGNKRQEWTWRGFYGWRCGQLSWGSRPDCSIAVASGAASATYWKRLSALATNCSRLDLAVTVEVPDESVNLATQALAQYKRFKQHTPNSATWSYIQSETGGGTLYLGRRVSDIFFRLYDKHAEDAEHYPNPSWRYELELKRKVALSTLLWLRGQRSAEDAVLAIATDYLRRRGIDCPWRQPSVSIELRTPRLQSTDESRLRWLREQVAPAVADLLCRRSRLEVLDALGLVDSPTAEY
jgi:hypothetical protein